MSRGQRHECYLNAGTPPLCHDHRVTEHPADRRIRRLSTPRAAAVAGVLFALLFGTSLVLIRLALPEGEEAGAQWLQTGSTNLKTAATIMPFAAIAFLWFMGVVRDGLGRYEDKFFSTVFLGSGLLFLAMMFVAAGVGAGLERSHAAGDPDVATFGQMMLLAVSKTYALRMAAVFMISLATIWLKTGLMPRWLVALTY